MILAVNLENTVISLGCFDREQLVFTEQTAADRVKTGLDYMLLFRDILRLHEVSPEQIEGGIISSVVPGLTDLIWEACHRLFEKRFLIAGPGIKTGLSILMDNPAQVGNDLAASAVAALEFYPAPLLVISLGTANCFCVINEKSQYVGAVIMPGMQVSLDALRAHAAQLPEISIDMPKKLLGSNTVQSMKSGILYGTASGIDGMISRIEEETGENLTVVMTGAHADLLSQLCRHEIMFRPNLLLEGLRLIYEKNQNSRKKTK